MKKIIPVLVALAAFSIPSFSQWKPVGDKIKTLWTEKVDPTNVLPEYPRPLLERAQWQNLNGLWNYAITPLNAPLPTSFEGKILVPFALESSLSGVGKTINGAQNLWYEREFEIHKDWKHKEILLNFGAVDWKAEVFVNGKLVGEHTGGFTPFSFNISKFLKDGKNSLAVKVWDSTGSGLPRGKQSATPHGIFYTSVSGIWQTVWLEPVNKAYVSAIKITPDLDSSSFDIKVDSPDSSAVVDIKILDKGRVVAETKAAANKTANLPVANPKLWSPDSPFLYDVKIALSKNGQQTDTIKSYAAMRKFSVVKKGKWEGVDFLLNNKKFFTFAPLDQGWWPDGLYTAPTDEALVFDIKKTKDLGFNSIRKHVKVEPARWYAHCDRLGIVVWQDMPSMFGEGNAWQPRGMFQGEEKTVSPKFEATFRKEWREIIESLYSYPCIAIWTPFNEGWGQFKTKEIAEWTKSLDPTRLVNPASGGSFFDCGDILDCHNYNPAMTLFLFNNQKINVLGEYGGIGCAIDGHLWIKDKNWGYGSLKTKDQVTETFVKLSNKLLDMARNGCFGAVYTQTTDVEIEVNGLFTYDRKVLKVDKQKVREANLKVINAFK